MVYPVFSIKTLGTSFPLHELSHGSIQITNRITLYHWLPCPANKTRFLSWNSIEILEVHGPVVGTFLLHLIVNWGPHLLHQRLLFPHVLLINMPSLGSGLIVHRPGTVLERKSIFWKISTNHRQYKKWFTTGWLQLSQKTTTQVFVPEAYHSQRCK